MKEALLVICIVYIGFMAMKIGSISQLIGGLVSSTSSANKSSQNTESIGQESAQASAPAQQSEAVSVSSDIGGSGESDRAAYVAAIKSRVDDGSYSSSVSSEKIAQAMVRDLF
jgi:anti-sigma28 factor (negative regulator of flagellin synthesis)